MAKPKGTDAMDNSPETVFVDGISAIGTHNGVHRIVCYQLSESGQPKPNVELQIPAAAVRAFAEAIARLR